MIIISIISLLCLVFIVSQDAASISKQYEKSCGYNSCPPVDKTKLNIHLIAHSHDDLGWLNTVEGYYQNEVNNILTTSVKELMKNPERRFVYSETGFFWIWWERQNEEIRNNVRQLVNEGRLEFVNGGWSMPDEAVSHYQSLLDQYTWGFRRLNDTFGSCARSRVGWQIDPFGHSREVASMFSQFGFDGLFFARLDHQDKNLRLKENRTEFIWHGNPSAGESHDLFTSVLYHHYNAPNNLCFDEKCDDFVNDYNVDEKANTLIEFSKEQASHYKTNNVLLTMGDDFHYNGAFAWFYSLDKLITYTNKVYNKEVNVIYSTPSCYIKAVHDHQVSLTTKSDDFFPYGSDDYTFWTGYYTSRPTSKFFERFGNNYLQIAKQLSSLTNVQSYESNLEKLREIMGVFQHHDAITGTEKQYVADDYAEHLHKNIKQVEPLVSDALKKLLVKDPNLPSVNNLKLHSCLLLNTSSCEYTENYKRFVVTVYNPTSHVVSPYVTLPVKGNSYTVKNYAGKKLVTQVAPILEALQKLPGRQGVSTNELVFKAKNIAPFGFQSFYISENKRHTNLTENNDETLLPSDKNDYTMYIDKEKNIVLHSEDSNKLEIKQTFESYVGNNRGRPSGAYIFRPQSLQQYNGVPKIYRNVKGKLFRESHIKVSDEVSEVIRLYNEEDYIQYDWVVGPISDHGYGRSGEVISKFKTEIENNEVFYTDSNGRSMMERKLNYRPTWNLTLKEHVAGNYYPVTTKIYIEDKEQGMRMAALTDRAQGGSSLKNGEIELMVHRRTTSDDGLGVDESLQERAYGELLVVRGQHIVIASKNNLEKQIMLEKSLASQLSLRPLFLFTPLEDGSYQEWERSYYMKGSGMAQNLPPNVQILTLEPWKDDTILLRLEHLYESNECEKYSQPVTVNIKKLFTTFTVESVQETTLGGNLKTEELERFKWTPEYSNFDEIRNLYKINDAYDVVLKPFEIRTFIIKVSHIFKNTI